MSGTIVLGYDGSDSANAALARTAGLAGELEAPVVVVFAYYISPLGGGEGAQEYRSALERVGQHEVGRAIADLEAAKVEASSRIVAGRPADAILDVAAEVGASLIAVGTVGEGPISGAILGRGAQAGTALDGAASRRAGAGELT